MPNGSETGAFKILIVDDNDKDRLMLTQQIEVAFPRDYEITEATSLTEAMNVLLKKGESGFDMIILDVTLRDSPTSTHAVRQIRKRVPVTPIVISSNKSEVLTAEAMIEAGANDYVVKGTNTPKELVRTILVARARMKARHYPVVDQVMINEMERTRNDLEKASPEDGFSAFNKAQQAALDVSADTLRTLRKIEGTVERTSDFMANMDRNVIPEIKRSLEDHSKIIGKIDVSIRGNGKKGLTERLAITETKIDDMSFRIDKMPLAKADNKKSWASWTTSIILGVLTFAGAVIAAIITKYS